MDAREERGEQIKGNKKSLTKEHRDQNKDTERNGDENTPYELDECKGYVSNIFKAYSHTDDLHAGSTMDSFDRKFALFIMRSDHNDLTHSKHCKAFFIIFSGAARGFSDKRQGTDMSLDNMALRTTERFETAEHTRALLREWKSAILSLVITENKGKSGVECVHILVNRLKDLQASLPIEYRSQAQFRDKSVNAARYVKAYRLACYKPADTVPGVISDLHSSLSTLNIITNT